ncbi:hypothetical protein MCOR27_006008 [Pyricularia oryzae]|nr:hypothetical protein MCOR19_004927 [Pyricularia oryzae]KAI6277444.1 hypothetical protein MCOR27_006008 [Pyricularia oryzae]KAI6323027.1 hypothetical protein MCOR30_007428 [Pyricularia oryzae]KAI6468242.1 hypothetical protein MCOR15_002228 [Pyricularia oryzae]KAI6493552.1 hypothetical protein MCOR18_001425 [Pyricularia oryzae]
MSTKSFSRALPVLLPALRRRAYQTSSKVLKPTGADTVKPVRPVDLPPQLLGRPQHLSNTSPSWVARGDEEFSTQSLLSLFRNEISNLKVDNFLSPEECARLAAIVETHQIAFYGESVQPPIGCIGITQFDHAKSKSDYFDGVIRAQELQQRFIAETGIDVAARVRAAIQQVAPPGVTVRTALEEEKPYFFGLLRMINRSALIHADYGAFDGPGWEIGRITAQLTWNLLLKEVRGGESVVYRRPWRGPEDDAAFKVPGSYGYDPKVVQGAEFAVLPPKVGQLSLFNPR